jgi:SAM-dependent methyltransferase
MSGPGVSSQEWSARRYAETAHFVPALGAPVLELLAPSAGERILDLGCGDGVLTEKIAAAGVTVVAVDAAPEMVAAARARGIDARVMPGQNLTFDGEFDAVFTNAALHWMRPPERVLAGVRRALRPGGRFVGEMGGHNNMPEQDRSIARAEVANLLRPVLVDETGTWIADYVRLRFRATLPG